jgi:hypothetical protein
VTMMLRMMMLRRGKIVMLRKMMLRRRTDPKTGTQTLCGPAQSKCTCTCHESNFVCENFQIKCCRPAGSQDHGPHFARACAVETHLEISPEPLSTEIYK